MNGPTIQPKMPEYELLYPEMTDEEYDRLYPTIRGNLTNEERMFFAVETGRVQEFYSKRERGWKRLAFFFGAVSALLFTALVWWVQ